MTVLYKFFGLALVAIGLPWMWLPIPFGSVLVALGLSLYISHSRRGRARVRRLRGRHGWLDLAMLKACDFLPAFMADPLARTACPPGRPRKHGRPGLPEPGKPPR